jgi:hypothetical protein
VVVFGIKPSPPSAARVVASSVRSRSNASRSLVPLATWRGGGAVAAGRASLVNDLDRHERS